jgi:hypothetical protein
MAASTEMSEEARRRRTAARRLLVTGLIHAQLVFFIKEVQFRAGGLSNRWLVHWND